MTARIGLLGAGNMGRAHLRAWRGVGVEPVGVLAGSAATTAAFAGEHGLAAFGTFEDLLAASSAVDICTPVRTHARYAAAAAAAGLDVVCEKPLASSTSEAAAVVAVCAGHGVRLLVAHVLRFFPAYDEARRLIRAGALGEPRHAELRRFSTVQAVDLERFAVEAGGVTLDLLIHDIDWAAWTFGPPVTVRHEPADGQTRAAATAAAVRLGWASGLTATISGAWNVPGSATSFEVTGSEATLVGSPSGLQLVSAAGGRTDVPLRAIDPYTLQAHALKAALGAAREFPVSPSEALAAVRYATS